MYFNEGNDNHLNYDDELYDGHCDDGLYDDNYEDLIYDDEFYENCDSEITIFAGDHTFDLRLDFDMNDKFV